MNFAHMETKYNRVKVVLAEKGVSQKDLALKIGLSTNAVSSICTNKSQPGLKTLFEIAKVLNVDPCDLLNRESPK